ncbi:unnamed protein product [Ranitomeya imitator]|uniref:Band 7 domain-containing protein n=1 Tax=Ranitomeya imitator TaxID=111125 RepID=A0ABN9LN67_9NEOB|nr:unnamed protein product [Ranitomeya imitator]
MTRAIILMVLPLDQMLKGGSAQSATTSENSSASNILRLPSSSRSADASSEAQSASRDIMDQRRANARRVGSERGIILRFGKVLRDSDDKPLVYEPGLHFKIPFIESLKTLDARIQTMDNQADRFVTKEKKDLIVDSYIKWRISDFSRYYLATGGGDISQAEVLLKRKFSDRLRSEIGRLDVKDIVTDSRGRLTLDVRDALNSGSFFLVLMMRVRQLLLRMMLLLLLLPVLFKKQMAKYLSLIKIVWQHLVSKWLMCVLSKLTCQQKFLRLSTTVCVQNVKQLLVAIVLKVKKKQRNYKLNAQARITRGEGDAEAAKLFADAFSKDPDFYAFLRSLRAYEASFKSNQDVMVLSPDSDFLPLYEEA